MKKHLFLLYVLFLFISACKKPFTPEITASNNNLLVVEGLINTGADSTLIKLSRTVAVASQSTTLNPETGATVTVESDQNEVFPLPELSTKKGTYGVAALNLNINKKYRLRIKTLKGTYLSDFVEAKATPAIDNIGYSISSDGIKLYNDAHDATNNTRYYRWEYVETYIFYAKYESKLFWNGSTVDVRSPTNGAYKCWATINSSRILLGSTVKLDQDVIFQNPIIDIPSSSEKLTEKYSILLKQYALTKEAYEFWQQLKKNTESLGSIFDAQPSQLTGNIHNVADASEPVIGYISAGTVVEKRIYLNKSQFPLFRVVYPFDCDLPIEVKPKTAEEFRLYFGTGQNTVIDFGPTGGYLTTGRQCGDCTLRGANKQPSFWQ